VEVDTLGGCGQAPERTPWSKLSLQPKRRDWGGRAQVGPSAPTARSKQGGLLRREGGRARLLQAGAFRLCCATIDAPDL
jgi:hypothetical protein